MAALPPIKVLLIGDSGVGKSSLMLRFASNTFSQDISATIGIDFKVKATEVVDPVTGERRTVKMQIWDTAGQERFRTLTSSYYRGAHAVVLVYDVNESPSFQALDRWLEEATSFCGAASTVFLLIGNKIDAVAGPAAAMAVSKDDGHAFAKQHKMLFCLCSAKTKEGVDQAFDEVARAVVDRLAGQTIDASGASDRHVRLARGGDAGDGGAKEQRQGLCC
jgi:Ras-related protein Rab-18